MSKKFYVMTHMHAVSLILFPNIFSLVEEKKKKVSSRFLSSWFCVILKKNLLAIISAALTRQADADFSQGYYLD
jgi:hypothetical protein